MKRNKLRLWHTAPIALTLAILPPAADAADIGYRGQCEQMLAQLRCSIHASDNARAIALRSDAVLHGQACRKGLSADHGDSKDFLDWLRYTIEVEYGEGALNGWGVMLDVTDLKWPTEATAVSYWLGNVNNVVASHESKHPVAQHYMQVMKSENDGDGVIRVATEWRVAMYNVRGCGCVLPFSGECKAG